VADEGLGPCVDKGTVHVWQAAEYVLQGR